MKASCTQYKIEIHKFKCLVMRVLVFKKQHFMPMKIKFTAQTIKVTKSDATLDMWPL